MPVTLEQEVTAAIFSFRCLYLSNKESKFAGTTKPSSSGGITMTSATVSNQLVWLE